MIEGLFGAVTAGKLYQSEPKPKNPKDHPQFGNRSIKIEPVLPVSAVVTTADDISDVESERVHGLSTGRGSHRGELT